MRGDGVIYVAGHPLLNRRCTRLAGCIRLRNYLYCDGWGVKLYSLTHSLTRSPVRPGLPILLVTLLYFFWSSAERLAFAHGTLRSCGNPHEKRRHRQLYICLVLVMSPTRIGVNPRLVFSPAFPRTAAGTPATNCNIPWRRTEARQQ